MREKGCEVEEVGRSGELVGRGRGGGGRKGLGARLERLGDRECEAVKRRGEERYDYQY